ncbi:unnamed protein product [Arabis nemorensis]|uniref:Uncharacterized protein n=1 Tax=Arabis nemorensis TaxID=586526 RepID=A0A565ASX2_9BRAS|nr:unnamed protein product [Arabis nemorensis]
MGWSRLWSRKISAVPREGEFGLRIDFGQSARTAGRIVRSAGLCCWTRVKGGSVRMRGRIFPTSAVRMGVRASAQFNSATCSPCVGSV